MPKRCACWPPPPGDAGRQDPVATLRVIEYQDAWPRQYAEVEAELRSALAMPGFILEHIGSTAVPGLCAKPVLDVALAVGALTDVEAEIAGLARLGFVYRPGYEQHLPDRRYFVRDEGRVPRVHLHAVVLGSRLWLQHLQLRAALRDNAALTQAYAALKRHLAVAHAADKAAYTAAKAPFIEQALGLQSSA